MSSTTARAGLPGWLFAGSVFAIGTYGMLLLVALVDPEPDNLAALVIAPLLVVLTIPIAVRIARTDGDPTVVMLLVVAVALKLTGALLRYYVAIDLYGGLADAASYHEAGALFAPTFRSLNFDVEAGKIPGTGFVEVVTGVVYAITGASRLGGFFVYSWFGLIGQILCWRAFKMAVPGGDSRRYALLILFLPSMLYWPSSIGKEGWMLLTIGLTAYGVARLLTGRSLGITLTAVGIAGVTMVRPHIALVLLASLLAALLLKRPESGSTLAPVVRLVSIGAVLAITLAVVGQTESFFGVSSLNQESVQTTITDTEETTAQGGSSFTPVSVNTPLDLPAASVTVLFRPLPFEADNIQTLVTSFEGLFLIALCVLSWRRFAAIPRLMRSVPYVAFAVVFVLLFVYAFSSFSNFGILARQRTQVFPFLFVLLALPPIGRRLARHEDSELEDAAREPTGRFDRWTRRGMRSEP
jgi:hypothetical protein